MNNREPIVYVVDDDVSVCRSVGFLLKAQGFKVETFTRALEFMNFKRPTLPSCLVLDIQLPDINGLDLQELLKQRGIDLPNIFITGHGDISMCVKGMKAGAVDFLTKPFTQRDLLGAVTRAIEQNKSNLKEQARIAQIKKRIEILSPREYEVFRLVALGMLSKQIARKRGTSLQTIKVHRSRVMRKMQAGSLTELVHFARKAGVVSFPH
jgi:FixJ family two-component response regulator